MTADRDTALQRAHAVLDWNRRHLRHDVQLTDALVGECFAEAFVVKPNGRHYDATRASYREFLDGMKRNMTGIDYDVGSAVVEGASVVLSLRASITDLDGQAAQFVALLHMRFDDAGKVTLWEEVYVPTPT